MRILLDTHAFLWFIMNSPELSSVARTLVEDAGNDVFLSAASIWEIAIKTSLGKLSLDEKIGALVERELQGNAMVWLPIELPQLARARRAALSPPRPVRQVAGCAVLEREHAHSQPRRGLRCLRRGKTVVNMPAGPSGLRMLKCGSDIESSCAWK